MHGLSRLGCWLRAVVLGLIVAQVIQAQQIPGPADFPQVDITSGQQLVDELQAVYATGTNATLLLRAGVTSLANSTWQVPPGPSVSGWASVVGVDASSGNTVGACESINSPTVLS
jgi:hypothetical protein